MLKAMLGNPWTILRAMLRNIRGMSSNAIGMIKNVKAFLGIVSIGDHWLEAILKEMGKRRTMCSKQKTRFLEMLLASHGI